MKTIIIMANSQLINRIKTDSSFCKLVNMYFLECRFYLELLPAIKKDSVERQIAEAELAGENIIFKFKHFPKEFAFKVGDKYQKLVISINLTAAAKDPEYKEQYLLLNSFEQFKNEILANNIKQFLVSNSTLAVDSVVPLGSMRSQSSLGVDIEDLEVSPEEVKLALHKLRNLGIKIKWNSQLPKVFSGVIAVAGAYTSMYFAGGFAKVLFANNSSLAAQVAWAKAVSALSNFSINFTSVNQLSVVARKFVLIGKKIWNHEQHGHSMYVNKWWVGAGALALMALNIGTFFSNLELARATVRDDASAKESPVFETFLVISQVIAAVILNLRSTVNSTIDMALPERAAVAAHLKSLLINEFNSLVHDSKKFKDEELRLLVAGKFSTNSISLPGKILSGVLIFDVLLYCYPVAISALLATSGVAFLEEYAPYATYLTRFMLLAKSALVVRDVFNSLIDYIRGNNILTQLEGRVPFKADLVLALTTIALFWNNGFGAAGLFNKYAFKLPDMTEPFLDPASGVGLAISFMVGTLAASPINIIDTLKLVRLPLQAYFGSRFERAASFPFIKLRTQWASDSDEFFKKMIVRIAEMSTDEILELFTTEAERDVAQRATVVDAEIFEKGRIVTNKKYADVMQLISKLCSAQNIAGAGDIGLDQLAEVYDSVRSADENKIENTSLLSKQSFSYGAINQEENDEYDMDYNHKRPAKCCPSLSGLFGRVTNKVSSYMPFSWLSNISPNNDLLNRNFSMNRSSSMDSANTHSTDPSLDRHSLLPSASAPAVNTNLSAKNRRNKLGNYTYPQSNRRIVKDRYMHASAPVTARCADNDDPTDIFDINAGGLGAGAGSGN